MPLLSAESLIEALRGSGLYPAAEADALVAELGGLGDDPQALMRHLLARKRITLYQLRKVVHGRTAELFIGPYVVLDKLGEGGMGKVFRARHARTGRQVALKVVRSDLLANPVIRGRYEREVEAALALTHENIVSVFSAGSTDGRYYLEMEFVDGIDLARLVRTYGVTSVPEACEYVRQAAVGLHHAHELGFVHRDIKPGNVIVSGERHVPEAGGPAFVKILDMGLVRSVGFDEDGPRGTDLTRDGTVVGTPDYMAPEQAKNSSTVDRRADLYSLGGTFYFLLTGRPPFPATSPVEKILKHQLDPPPPLQASRPDVPDELARIVARLMAKKPEGRFATAAELAEALGPFVRFTPGVAVAGGRGPVGVVAAPETLPPSSPTVPPFEPDAAEHQPVGDPAGSARPTRTKPRGTGAPRKRPRVKPRPQANVFYYRLAAVLGLLTLLAAIALAVAFGPGLVGWLAH
jgi:serine/threonine-protein kinase